MLVVAVVLLVDVQERRSRVCSGVVTTPQHFRKPRVVGPAVHNMQLGPDPSWDLHLLCFVVLCLKHGKTSPVQ